ncbi:MAG TPA: tRNA-dihydrouridine synthase, partial [Bacteroidales bacterium]
TVHGRTQKMMSTGQALWTEIAKAADLRNKTDVNTVMIGNGDVTSCPEASEKTESYGVDGVMVGTGIFKNPWMFRKDHQEITTDERFDLLQKHIELFRDTWNKRKNYNILKRFYKIYLNGFHGASDCRGKMMQAQGYDEALSTLKMIKKEISGYANN